MKYASNTNVSAEHTRAEIERMVANYGADKFFSGWESEAAIIGFRMKNRFVRFVLKTPKMEDFEKTEAGRTRHNEDVIRKAHEQGIRQSWRALLLIIKAKLEAVESQITSFDNEFLAHIMLPDGGTVGDWAAPQVEQAYSSGTMPRLLPGFGV